MRSKTSRGSSTVWCEQEEQYICRMVKKNGLKGWAKMAIYLEKVEGFPRKTGRQCRERWYNHLDPSILKSNWTQEEEHILYEEHKKHGARWTLIAQKLPGRCDNAIKNHFYALMRKNLRKINKYLGEKNSSVKIGKIKSSTLSRLLSIDPASSELESLSLGDSAAQKLQNSQAKDFAYRLLFFSRSNLLQKLVPLEKDLRKFHNLLQKIQKMNEIYEQQLQNKKKIQREKKLMRNYDEAILEEQQELEQESDAAENDSNESELQNGESAKEATEVNEEKASTDLLESLIDSNLLTFSQLDPEEEITLKKYANNERPEQSVLGFQSFDDAEPFVHIL